MTDPNADDLRDLSPDRFELWIASTFKAEADGRTISLELVAVVKPPVDEFHLAARQRGGIRLQPFNLHFKGPRSERFGQGMRRLEHPALGALDIFLVPIGADATGLLYEAVFN
jgi:hypothetical protein